MTAYIIAYSIILTLLAAATVCLSVLWVRGQKRKLDARAAKAGAMEKGEQAFVDVYGKGRHFAFVLLKADSREPVYVSPGVSAFFGVSAETFAADPASARKALDKKDVRAFLRAYAAWDGTDVLTQSFGYGEAKFATAEAFRVERDGERYDAFTVYDSTVLHAERQTMREALDAALGQAAAKSSFLSSMSHEIRTPMNGVMGMMALARMNIRDPEKALGYLERAGDLSVFLLGMINDILDISKIESGKMQLFNTTLDVFAFADKIRNMFNGTVTGKGIDFCVETVDFTARYLVCDELRLTQVVTNFISNANKFTPAGGKITVTFKQLDRIGGCVQLLIRVRDTGKGIAPENIRKIMRPFEQEEASTAHNYGGTGLGLAICDNIVRMMGGNIVVDSELGKGTDFSVFLSLPVADVEQDMDKPIAQKETPKEVEFAFDGCRILLAEDNEVNAEIAVEILESEGAVVTHAHDGQEAVDVFTERPAHSFDLILLDIQMPRLNGREAAAAMRRSDKADAASVPIVALSADAFVEDVELSKAAGMDDHVAKPIDFDALRKTAGAVIAEKKAKFGV